jgi:predicted sulfurtransferase
LLGKYQPAPHLSPQQWHEQLQQASSLSNNPSAVAETHLGGSSISEAMDHHDAAVLLDARNVYESRVGFFSAPHIPTILANTRKYSDLPKVMQEVATQLSNKDVYMYCTGGVRCERASIYLQALSQSTLWNADLPPPKRIFQLQGGIQRYLEEYGQWEQPEIIPTEKEKAPEEEENTVLPPTTETLTIAKSLFRGKNFVFDPRRTDPRVSNDVVGRCLLCGVPHDDYDNGAAPCEEQEARCQKCRVLLLVCPACRPSVQWKSPRTISIGDHADKKDERNIILPPLFCGRDQCVDEGNLLSQITTVLFHSDTKEIHRHEP